jgi:hypothetical protein
VVGTLAHGGEVTVALLSLGRNVVVAERVKPVGPAGSQSADDVRDEANRKLEDARKSLLDTLTPWIPGDFIVTYGVLLTAWSRMRANFGWLLIIASVSAITYVVLGAFAETGFRRADDRSTKVKQRLIGRTIAGFVVSLYAATAIPTSGWYDFKWFSDNELSWVVTGGVLVVIVVFILKGLQKRLGFSLGNN